MATLIAGGSPRVVTREVDLSNTVSPAGTSVGATVIAARQGPVNRAVFLTNSGGFNQTFGAPVLPPKDKDDVENQGLPTNNERINNDLRVAARYADDSNALYAIRATGGVAKNQINIETLAGSGAYANVSLHNEGVENLVVNSENGKGTFSSPEAFGTYQLIDNPADVVYSLEGIYSLRNGDRSIFNLELNGVISAGLGKPGTPEGVDSQGTQGHGVVYAANADNIYDLKIEFVDVLSEQSTSAYAAASMAAPVATAIFKIGKNRGAKIKQQDGQLEGTDKFNKSEEIAVNLGDNDGSNKYKKNDIVLKVGTEWVKYSPKKLPNGDYDYYDDLKGGKYLQYFIDREVIGWKEDENEPKIKYIANKEKTAAFNFYDDSELIEGMDIKSIGRAIFNKREVAAISYTNVDVNDSKIKEMFEDATMDLVEKALFDEKGNPVNYGNWIEGGASAEFSDKVVQAAFYTGEVDSTETPLFIGNANGLRLFNLPVFKNSLSSVVESEITSRRVFKQIGAQRLNDWYSSHSPEAGTRLGLNSDAKFPAYNTADVIAIDARGFTPTNTNGEPGLIDVEDQAGDNWLSDLNIVSTGPGEGGNNVGVFIVRNPITNENIDMFIDQTTGRLKPYALRDNNIPEDFYGFDWFGRYDAEPTQFNIETGKWELNPYAIWHKLYKVIVYRKGNRDPESFWNFRANTADIGYLEHLDGSVSFYPDINAYLSRLDINRAEMFMVSNDAVQDENMTNYNIMAQVNGYSDLIYVPNGGHQVLPPQSVRVLGLSNGKKVPPPTYSHKTAALTLLNSQEKIKFNILLCAPLYNSIAQDASCLNYIRACGNLAPSTNRQDIITVVQASGMLDNTPEKIIQSGNIINSFDNPSYVALYVGFDKIVDPNLNAFAFMPRAYAGAMLMARVDNIARTWDAPAGINRGGIGYSLAPFPMLTSDQYNAIYDNNLNAALKRDPYGIVMWGQRTAQLKKSVLDAINVRRLLLYVKNTIKVSLLPFLWEKNTDSTRMRVTAMLSDFLATVYNGGGLYQQAQVICDESNNPPAVIANKQLNVAIVLMPTIAIEYIEFTTIVLNVGMDAGGMAVSEALA